MQNQVYFHITQRITSVSLDGTQVTTAKASITKPTILLSVEQAMAKQGMPRLYDLISAERDENFRMLLEWYCEYHACFLRLHLSLPTASYIDLISSPRTREHLQEVIENATAHEREAQNAQLNKFRNCVSDAAEVLRNNNIRCNNIAW